MNRRLASLFALHDMIVFRFPGTNAILTSLDQLANVLSPLFLGAILSFASLRTTCIILAGLSTNGNDVTISVLPKQRKIVKIIFPAYSAISFILKGTLLITLYESHDRLKRKVMRILISNIYMGV